MSAPLTPEELDALSTSANEINLRAHYSRWTEAELTAAPPEQKWIVTPYVPAETVTVLAGPGGMNKTTWTVELAVCRALGRSLPGGCKPTTGETVILSTEDRRDDYHRKLAAQRQHLGEAFNAELVSKRIHFVDCSGVPVRLVRAEFGQYLPTLLPEAIAEVLSEKAPKADLLVMETVSRLAGGAETNESLSIVVESAQRICRLAKVAVKLVAHVSQDAGRRGVADAYAPRGGSALGDNGRSTIVLTSVTPENVKTYADGLEVDEKTLERLRVLVHAKANGARKADPLLLERVSTPYGPILREAHLSPHLVDDPAAQLDRLCATVGRLAKLPTPIRASRTRLRTYLNEIGCAKHALERLVDDAVGAGRLVEVKTGGRGGGTTLELPPEAA